MNRTWMLVTLTGVLLTGIGGCAAPDISPSPGLPDPYPAPYHDPQISVLNQDLQEWVRFHPAIIRDNGEQPMHVEIPARNLGGRQYLIQYRYIFRDKDGFELEPVMGWKRAAIGAKSTVYLKGTALSLDAETYKLEVKWAQ